MPIARLAVLLAAMLSVAPASAQTQDYPNRPITLVLPLGAGGSMDVIARGHFGPKLSERLGKPVIIENRTGGGTVIAATSVAKSPPDGHTLFFVPAATLTVNSTLYKSLPYDPRKDFVPAALTSKLGFVLVVNPSLPVHSVADLVKYAKANPGKLSYGSTGIGATPHLAFEMLKTVAGLDLIHVPYKGMPPAQQDVVAGHIHMLFTDPTNAPAMIKEGKLRALAVSSLARIPTVPDVPTMAEAGFPGFEAVSWHMIVAPAGTPKEIVSRLNTAFREIVALPEVRKYLGDIGLIPIDTPPPDDLKRYLDEEIVRWGKLVEQVGIAGTQ